MQELVSLVALVVLMWPAFSRQTGDSKSQTTQSQAADTQSSQDLRDLTARKTALLTDSQDLEAMAQSLNGVQGGEFSTAMSLDEKASQGIMEVDAAIWFVALYSKMQCEPDREVARAALKNRLGFYAHLLDMEADNVGGHLSFTKLPAIAQSGARVRDELRGAKAKMDEIAGRL
jgi:hypothetical protein